MPHNVTLVQDVGMSSTDTDFDQVSYQGRHGTVDAFIARPAGAGPFPAVLLLQEGIGVTKHLLSLASRFARERYVALVPDLYTRDLERKRLAEDEVVRALPLTRAADRDAQLARLPWHEQESAKRVLRWFERRDSSTYVDDAAASIPYLKRHAQVLPQAIASVGFSMGAAICAQLAASGADLAAGVLFYGTGPAVSAIANVRYPLQGHYAEHDPVTAHVEALDCALHAARKSFSYTIYPGTAHGFFNDARPSYEPISAALAFRRTLKFLGEHLAVAEKPARREQKHAVS
jgi:carboxymethylenebutenolidase